MQLSHAIRIGARATKPAKQRYWRVDPDGSIAACALGAAVIGAAGKGVVNEVPPYQNFLMVRKVLPRYVHATVGERHLSEALIRTGAATPRDAESWSAELATRYLHLGGIPLVAVLTHLNDDHGLSRHAIASVVEDLGY